MKKYLLFILVAIMYTSIYAQNARVINAKRIPGYIISGTVEGLIDGDTVCICALKGLYLMREDTSIVTNGKFHFKGKTDTAKLRCIVASKNRKTIIFPFILGNERFEMKVMENVKFSTVTGSYNNDLWLEYNNHLIKMKERSAMRKEENNSNREDSAYAVKFIIDKLPSGTSDVLLEMMMSQLNKATIQTIMDKMKKVCPGDVLYMSLIQQRRIEENTALGRNYTDIALNTPEGKLIKVSDFVGKNKVTMVDFWASWCGPCRQEMPNVIKAYNEYKDKGFAVVGVSLDSDAAAWAGAIRKLGISWPQMSDLKGWQSAGAALYNVRSIPATVLIDQNGKIIAKDLRGEELQTKLKEIFK
ncbi:MAG: redoxin domain-containing protein [Bacteroidales bacterium]|nr:redoxin domain-containing protein [Bacteroidales bacterium]